MKKNNGKKKRSLSVAARTAVGMAAALVLAVAGYFVPGALLDAHVDGMLEQKQSVVAQEASADAVLTLSPEEYGDVLSLWYGVEQGTMRYGLMAAYHDPVVGQISMSVAIDAARDAVEIFVDKKILPKSCMDEQLLSYNAALYNASMDESNRDYRASFWGVSLQNSYCDLSLSINAVTAEVWCLNAWLYSLDGEETMQDWCYASSTGRIEGYVDYLGSGSIEDYEKLVNDTQLRAVLRDVPYDILSEQSDPEEWLDGNPMWLRLRMIPKSYTFQNLIDEYEQNDRADMWGETKMYNDDETEYALQWR